MNDELTFISYEVAVEAKKAGFDIPVKNYYDKQKSNSKPYLTYGQEYNNCDYDCTCTELVSFDWNLNTPSSKQVRAPYPNKYSKYQVSAPTQTLFSRWLRQTHGIHVIVTIVEPHKYNYEIAIQTKTRRSGLQFIYGIYEGFDYEEALEDGFKKVFKEKLIKK